MEKSIDYKKIEALWTEKMEKETPQFVKEYIPMTEDNKPECLGTNHPYKFCYFCLYYHVC